MKLGSKLMLVKAILICFVLASPISGAINSKINDISGLVSEKRVNGMKGAHQLNKSLEDNSLGMKIDNGLKNQENDQESKGELNWEEEVKKAKMRERQQLEKIIYADSEEDKEDYLYDTEATEETDNSRVTRLIIYFIFYGILMEISLMIARYKRHDPSHDETHAALMVAVALVGLAMDIWYIIANKEDLMKTDWTKANISIIAGVTFFLILQIIFGAQTRVKMRRKVYTPNYYSRRNLHMITGILLWIATKVKLWIVCRLEDDKQQLSFSINKIALYYFLALVIARIILEIFIKKKHYKFRNKMIQFDKNQFNSDIKQKHKHLLDFLKVKQLENIMGLFKDLNWVLVEDRVFDIKDLDHPGGAFILEYLTGRDLSPYIYGQNAFNLTGATLKIKHSHSAFALNYLEKRFIGFLEPPAIILKNRDSRVEYDSMNNSILSLDKQNKQKEFVYQKLKNDIFEYSWKVELIFPIKPHIAVIFFRSDNYLYSLGEDPFSLFGKYFNIRLQGTRAVRQYSCVLSLSRDHLQYKRGLFKVFLDKSGLYTDPKLDNATTNLDNPNTVISTLPFVVKKYDSGLFIKKFFGGASGHDKIWNIKGPFGPGLQVKKFSTGKHVFFGMGTGNNTFIDFIDYLARKLIFTYASQNFMDEKGPNFDPFKNDFEMCFFNDVQFSFYMSFKSGKEFEELFGENVRMIMAIKKAIPSLKLVDKIVVRLSNESDINKSLYEGVDFLEKKVSYNTIRAMLSRLGVIFDKKENDIGKIIACGNKKFTDCISDGLKISGIGQDKYLIL